MKKILLFLVALVATLSMNAQTTEIYKGATLQKAYSGADVTVSFGENSITVKQGKVEDLYEGSEYNVVSKELPPSTGTAKATIGGMDVDVKWIQLWKDGPKFAEYNVGASSATGYGHYLAWGGSSDKVATNNAGSADLSGSDDSAYKVWGEHWRMPTNTDFSTLMSNCTCTWKTNYNGTGVNGLLCTGKGDYISNSIFLPVAGLWNKKDGVNYKDYKEGWYWSSTKTTKEENARCMHIGQSKSEVIDGLRVCGYFVRPIYVEDIVAVTGVSLDKTKLNVGKGDTETLSATVTPGNATNKKVLWTSSDEKVATVDAYGKVTGVKTGECVITATTEDGGKTATCIVEVVPNTGTATAKIKGTDVDVKWIQLWGNGPKFAEYNVGVTDGKAESYGGYYCWGKAIDKDSNGAYKGGTSPLTGDDDTATKLWGDNWRMPTDVEFEELLSNCTVQWTTNYNKTGKNGLLCTGKGAYSSNSIFLPAAGHFNETLSEVGEYGRYWSSIPKDNSSDRARHLYFESSGKTVGTLSRDNGYSVRAVLAK